LLSQIGKQKITEQFAALGFEVIELFLQTGERKESKEKQVRKRGKTIKREWK